MQNPTERFSDRVSNYVAARPSYPGAVIDLLVRACGLGPHSVVADIGSGSGLFTTLLLGSGAQVVAVEPNAAMRAAAEGLLGTRSGFTSVAASAEATGLADRAVDLVTVAQAFHWLDRAAARREFARILRPGGSVALIWNDRSLDGTPFLAAYEHFLQIYGTDYTTVNHQLIDAAALRGFFAPAPMQQASFPNAQRLDRAGLHARVRSSSYTPPPAHPQHQPMLAALDALFDAHQQDGHVDIIYATRIYYGQF